MKKGESRYAYGSKVRHAGGFTLVELMITLAVAAILATIAIPAYQSLVQQSTMTSAANNLLAAINYTRSEAVTRGTNVYICPRGDKATRCGGNWLDGWVVFLPKPGASQAKPTKDNRLRVHDAVTIPNLASTDNLDETEISKIHFSGSGFATGSAGTISLCDTTTDASTSIVISTTGRVRIETHYYDNGADCTSTSQS